MAGGGGGADCKPETLGPCEKNEERENTPDVINYIPKHRGRLREQIRGYRNILSIVSAIARFCFTNVLLLSLGDFHNLC
jgi:hypothetical protein